MILAIHQPNFLPRLAYFDKIARSDVFVLLDEVQYPRGKSFANRARIQGANGEVELVVPISIPKGRGGKATYREVRSAENKWRKKVLKALELNYKKAPFFSDVFPFLEEMLSIDPFYEMNVRIIREISHRVGLDTRFHLLSEFQDIREERTQRIIDLCKVLEADVYLSGQGGKNYNDPSLFDSANITLEYQEFQEKEYAQGTRGHIGGLSIVDPLFHLGFKGTGELLMDD